VQSSGAGSWCMAPAVSLWARSSEPSRVTGVLLPARSWLRGRRRRVAMAEKSIVESVTEAIIGSIRGTGEILNAVVDTVSGTLVNTIKGTGAVGFFMAREISVRHAPLTDVALAGVSGCML
jgi:hypothetical protein